MGTSEPRKSMTGDEGLGADIAFIGVSGELAKGESEYVEWVKKPVSRSE